MSHSICILYGLNEGPAIGRQLVKACEQAGFVVVHNPTAADIIFAHSGGCLLVPLKNKARLVVTVGIPYWPGRSWFTCLVIKVSREFRLYRQQRRLSQWGRKWTYHFRYVLNLKDHIRMAMNLGADKPWNSTQYQIILRNRDDATCSPHILDLPFKGPRTFISLPGEHDDCWDNPTPYVHLLQSLI